jgi:hypothetical protein
LCIILVSARPPPRGRGLAASTIATSKVCVDFNFSGFKSIVPGNEPEAQIVPGGGLDSSNSVHVREKVPK